MTIMPVSNVSFKGKNVNNILKKYAIFEEPKLSKNKIFNSEEDLKIMQQVNQAMENFVKDFKIKSHKTELSAKDRILD